MAPVHKCIGQKTLLPDFDFKNVNGYIRCYKALCIVLRCKMCKGMNMIDILLNTMMITK